MALPFAAALADGLLDGAEGELGALILNSIFPPTVPTYFAEVYQKIEKIVKHELTQNTIDTLNGKINGVKDYVRDTYTPAKKGGADKQVLFSMISEQQRVLVDDVIGTLEMPRYAAVGFTGYTIAAGMNLALLQERAFVDPEASEPSQSPYVGAIIENASSHAKKAKETYHTILERRRHMIVPDSYIIEFPGVYETNYGWKDKMTDKSDYYGTDESAADDERQKYSDKIISELKEKLGHPQQVIDKWSKLVENPLPC